MRGSVGLPWKPEEAREKLQEDRVKVPGDLGELGQGPRVLGMWDRRPWSGASAGKPAGRVGVKERRGFGGNWREKQCHMHGPWTMAQKGVSWDGVSWVGESLVFMGQPPPKALGMHAPSFPAQTRGVVSVGRDV